VAVASAGPYANHLHLQSYSKLTALNNKQLSVDLSVISSSIGVDLTVTDRMC